MFFSFIQGQYNSGIFGTIVRNAMVATNATLIVKLRKHCVIVTPNSWEYPNKYTVKLFEMGELDDEQMCDISYVAEYNVVNHAKISDLVLKKFKGVYPNFPISEVQFSLTDNVEDLFWVNVG